MHHCMRMHYVHSVCGGVGGGGGGETVCVCVGGGVLCEQSKLVFSRVVEFQ